MSSRDLSAEFEKSFKEHVLHPLHRYNSKWYRGASISFAICYVGTAFGAAISCRSQNKGFCAVLLSMACLSAIGSVFAAKLSGVAPRDRHAYWLPFGRELVLHGIDYASISQDTYRMTRSYVGWSVQASDHRK